MLQRDENEVRREGLGSGLQSESQRKRRLQQCSEWAKRNSVGRWGCEWLDEGSGRLEPRGSGLGVRGACRS